VSRKLSKDPFNVITGLNLKIPPGTGYTLEINNTYLQVMKDPIKQDLSLLNITNSGPFANWKVSELVNCFVRDSICVKNKCACPDTTLNFHPSLCLNENLDLNTLKTATTASGTWIVSKTPLGTHPATITGTTFTTIGADLGTYTLLYTLDGGPYADCADSNSRQITIHALPVPKIINPNLSICPQTTQVYNAEPHTGSSYSWSIFSGTKTNVAAQNNGEQYSVTFIDKDIQIQLTETNANQCSASTNITAVIKMEIPLITNPNPVCVFNSAKYSVTNRGGIYTWQVINKTGSANIVSTNANIVNLKTTTAGKVNLILTEVLNGCTMTDTLVINILPLPTLTFVLPPNICEKDTEIELKDKVTPKSGIFSGLGINGTKFHPSTPGLNINALNTIKYEYTDNNGCKNTISTQIKVFKNPTASITIDKTDICVGKESAKLEVTPPNPNYTYTWVPTGEKTHTIQASTSGEYHVLINFNGCTGTSNSVILNTHSTSIDAGGPYFVRKSDCQLIIPNTTSTPTSYVWTDLSNGEVISNTSSESICPTGNENILYYNISIQDNFGCIANDNFEIIVQQSIHIPEIITPNADGANDLWVIRNIEAYPKATVKVYNRWGNIVFEKAGYLNNWNGTRNGKPLPVATYYYVIELHIKGEEKPYGGSLTIMR
jgi:gliding motility-associated-like protein